MLAMPPMLECKEIRHVFGHGELAEEVLRGVNVGFERGEICVLMGPSGSGKTTLLSILGCLLTPTSGQLLMDGKVVDHRSKGVLGRLRRDKIGFVLLPFMSVRKNLQIVDRNAGLSSTAVNQRIEQLLDRLGI